MILSQSNHLSAKNCMETIRKPRLALRSTNRISTASLLLLLLPAPVEAQFDYTTNDGAIIIMRYTGAGGPVIIPSEIDGLPVKDIEGFCGGTSATDITVPDSVTNIGRNAFAYCCSLTNVTLGSGVATIGEDAFFYYAPCASLITITVDPSNLFFGSVDGVLFNRSQTTLIMYPKGRAGNYTVPGGVTAIGPGAFQQCDKLTSVTLPNGITNIGDNAFANAGELGQSILTNISLPDTITTIGNYAFFGLNSHIGRFQGFEGSTVTTLIIPGTVSSIGDFSFEFISLTAIFFLGNAPKLGDQGWLYHFDQYSNAPVVYHLPGTTGWGAIYGGLPTMLWNPQIQTTAPNFGVRTNQFGFAISGSSNLAVVVEASTKLDNTIWLPVSTNILTGGSSYFNDPNWINYPSRFYRLRPL